MNNVSSVKNALRRFLHNNGDRKKPKVGIILYSYRMTARALHSAQYTVYHRQHYTLQPFEQFRALYIHKLDDKHPTRPVFKPSTSAF